MKTILSLLIVTTFFSCGNIKYITLKNNTDASLEVKNQLNYIDYQLSRHNAGKKADFTTVNCIVSLSEISPSKSNGDWSGLHYTPTELDVEKWQNWYADNRNNFFYNDEHRIIKYFNKYDKSNYKNNSVVFLKNKDGKILSNIPYGTYVTAYNLLYQNDDLVNSQKVTDKVLSKIMKLHLGKEINQYNKEILLKLSKLQNTNNSMLAYNLLNWFNGYENYIKYEDIDDETKIVIEYPNQEKIIANIFNE